LTADQKAALKKELTDKYDTNKDGKIDKTERAKMTDAEFAAHRLAPRLRAKQPDAQRAIAQIDTGAFGDLSSRRIFEPRRARGWRSS